jgi:cytochrome b561
MREFLHGGAQMEHGMTYPWSIRVLHWLMALLILGMIAVGWYMTGLPDKDPLRGTLYPLHKSLGILLLALVALRVALRFSTPIPPLPAGIPPRERLAAKAGHVLLYLGMIVVPLTGVVMSVAGGYGIAFFGIPLPAFMDVDKPLAHDARELHELLPYILLGVIALHVAGALKHRFFDAPENDVLKRMTLRCPADGCAATRSD